MVIYLNIFMLQQILKYIFSIVMVLLPSLTRYYHGISMPKITYTELYAIWNISILSHFLF